MYARVSLPRPPYSAYGEDSVQASQPGKQADASPVGLTGPVRGSFPGTKLGGRIQVKNVLEAETSERVDNLGAWSSSRDNTWLCSHSGTFGAATTR